MSGDITCISFLSQIHTTEAENDTFMNSLHSASVRTHEHIRFASSTDPPHVSDVILSFEKKKWKTWNRNMIFSASVIPDDLCMVNAWWSVVLPSAMCIRLREMIFITSVERKKVHCVHFNCHKIGLWHTKMYYGRHQSKNNRKSKNNKNIYTHAAQNGNQSRHRHHMINHLKGEYAGDRGRYWENESGGRRREREMREAGVGWVEGRIK